MVTKAGVWGLAALIAAPGVASIGVPYGTSPGSSERIVPIESRCPTFSWSDVPGAQSYELLVYRLEEDPAELGLALRLRLPVPALSWTPSLDRCLERGSRYAWSVRAVGEDFTSPWSTPSLFEVWDGPRGTEVGQWAQQVRSDLEAAGGAEEGSGSEVSEPSRLGTAPDSAGTWVPGSGRGFPGSAQPAPAGEGVARPVLAPDVGVAITVEGEVRTVDSSGAARLWGKGRVGVVMWLQDTEPPTLCRNGDIGYGLSNVAVDWGSAAEACPLGTWVCTLEERGDETCYTLRNRTLSWGWDCSGEVVAEPYDGWVADAWYLAAPWGRTQAEGIGSGRPACETYPVWCCVDWE